MKLRCLLALSFAVAQEAAGVVHWTYSAENPAAPVRTEVTSSCTSGVSEYSTYVGVPDRVSISRIAVDGAGHTFVAGSRGGQPFLARLDSSGCLLFTVTLSTGGHARAVAVDAAGRIVVAGLSHGIDLPLPLRNALRERRSAGFLARFSSDGSQLLSSTYIDGEVNALAMDSDSNLYLTGSTGSTEFVDNLRVSIPAKGDGPSAVIAAYFLKLTPMADRVLASGYLSGKANDCGGGSGCALRTRVTSGVAIAVDAERNILFAGNTAVTDLPTSVDALLRKGIGAFVAKVSADGAKLLYSTYLGAQNNGFSSATNPANRISDMTVDAAGNAFLVGQTNDERFPATSGTLQPSYSGPIGSSWLNEYDGFVAKLNPRGSAVVWATYFGRNGVIENFRSISVDGAGNLLLSGTATIGSQLASSSSFIAGIDPNGTRFTYSDSFARGSVEAVSIGRTGLAHVASSSGVVSTYHPGAPVLPRIWGVAGAGQFQLSGEIVPGQIVSVFGVGIGPTQPASFTPDAGRVPTTLSDTMLYFGDVPAPLLYVSANQINALVPNALRPGSSVAIRSTKSTIPFTAGVFASSPSILAIVNQDGSPNTFSQSR